jgi:choline kinase
MRGVILAAGSGSRLRPVLGPLPKCLARVGDCTLIERQIRLLRECGVDPITAVVGHRADDVARVCGPRVEVVHNTRYATTNSLYSLWLARPLLAKGFIVLNADVLFDASLLAALVECAHADALLVARRQAGTVYSDEEMKVHVRGDLVAAIDKKLDDRLADGENVGIAKFGTAGASLLLEQMRTVLAAGGFREWLPRAFDGFCRLRALHVVATGDRPWIEIDFPEDYMRACREILPAIAARAATPAPQPDAEDRGAGTTFERVLQRV